ncbi:hypothetical protein LTR10_011510 [Elasticomyces elasticus]|uniref:Only prolin and serin are matching in the corresponding protein n=1 Tax=Exophiala sideris TaxID=1016849 RepID=A0ABR0JCP8_9EURO|nr:hypothetical protein LTR10_011510 [Elasticomyces elasticus]KAK5032032.1 hypothetical protein LTS07_004654 [Exophiala sideris]KAK5040961.1 hypothetical protein LTR13_003263 [Exophiala sideris]KAK5061705.1 hypothetical protein LTR69_004887 [Exophiala sideris]KAK5184405.1 hypothetical protein LTR44_003078 [Eurotiomycetes sp. CCFEE 6388]
MEGPPNTYFADATAPSAPRSSASSSSLSSPTASTFSKGHSSRGSGSSITSSPIPRESFDIYAKRLEDVTEEPQEIQERDEFEGYTLVNDGSFDFPDYDKAFSNYFGGEPSPPSSPVQPEWTLRDADDWSSTSSAAPPLYKRRRSMDSPTSAPAAAPVSTHRLSSKFGSISRRWKNRSMGGPQLSVITHLNSPASRSGSLNSSQIVSPAMSAISKHESLLPLSPVAALTSQTSFELETEPLQEPEGEEEEPCQATTPLLPPVLAEVCRKEEPIQSPLQSPSIAPTSAIMSSRNSFDTPLSCLPSPPLSTKPSMVSMHSRSWTNTMTNGTILDIPPLQLLDDVLDPWAARLGHANFTIHPEPYTLETIDLDSYTEYRNNWDHARTNYARHIARTAEHYGSTSKVYKLTEQKWSSVDDAWKRHHNLMRSVLAPVLARLSDGDSSMQNSTASSAVLEKPATKVVLPNIDDKSGKFPELGDGEIVGPMSVARPRAMTSPNRGIDPRSPSLSPYKRNLRKFLTEFFHR